MSRAGVKRSSGDGDASNSVSRRRITTRRAEDERRERSDGLVSSSWQAGDGLTGRRKLGLDGSPPAALS